MRKLSTILVAAIAVGSLAAAGFAAPITNASSGITGAGVQTITFDASVVPGGNVISNQYPGAVFSTNAPGGEGTIYQYNGEAGGLAPGGGTTNAFINVDISNGGPGGTRRTNPGEVVITFDSPVTDAAIQLVGQAGFVSLTSYLGGVAVETATGANSASANFGSTTNNYYGFSGSLFNQIIITPHTSDNSLIGDNLSFRPVVPEPASLSLLGLGAVGALRRRRSV